MALIQVVYFTLGFKTLVKHFCTSIYSVDCRVNMSKYDDMPPLDDMRGFVNRIKERQIEKEKKSNPPETKQKQPITKQPKDNSKDVNQSSGSFGGMKKGFLFGGKTLDTPKKKPAPAAEKVDYVVKPTKSEDGLVFNEVQNAIRDKFMANPVGWLTGDFLKKVQGNDKLLKQMSDQKFSAAVQLMHNDPQKAMEMYKDDKEVQDFFTDFLNLLGMHFSDLGIKQKEEPKMKPSSTSTTLPGDEEKMEKILANPEIREIMMKPDIQNLFHLLKYEPDKVQTLLNTCDDQMRADIQKLVAAGLLGKAPR